MTSTQLINDVAAALKEHIYLLDELNVPVVVSWDTIDRLTPGILDSPALRARFRPNTSMKNEEEIKFYVHCVETFEYKYILCAIFHELDQLSKSDQKYARLLTRLLNTYESTSLSVLLQKALVLCALFRSQPTALINRLQIDHRMVLTHVVNIMVEFTHRAEGCIYNLCRIIEFSKELKTLRADFFELHCKYISELKAGKSTLHTTTKQLYEDYGDILTGKDISEPKFTLFPALPLEIQYQIFEKIPTSTLLYCRLCSQHLNSLTKTVFRHRKRRASDELVKYLKTTRITDKCFGRNTIPYAEWPVGILRRAKWIRPKSSDACVTMPLKKLAKVLKCFEFSEKQLNQLNPDQFKLISVQNGM